MKKAAVIGSGLGGLSAAIYLKTKGIDVDVFEKNSQPGGKLNFYEESGYYFDTGPSILTMPEVIDNIFYAAGYNRNDFLNFIKIEHINRNFFSDGSIIDIYSDIDKLKQSVAKISESDADNIERYINYAKLIYDKSAEIFLFEPLHEVKKLLKEKKIPSLFDVRYIDAFRTMNEANSSFFKDDRIRKIFNRYATYNGSNPYQTPATMNIISYVELILGGYYVKGGMYKLGSELFNLAQRIGVNFHFNKYADKIIVRNNQAVGLQIENENLGYDFIISNCDVITTHKLLLDNHLQKYKKYHKLEPSLSGFVMLLGIKKEHNLAQHNVFFSDNYQNEFKQIFDELVITDDPTIYISISSKHDKLHAPENSENWFVLVNVPYQNDKVNWDSAKYLIRDRIINKLEKFGFKISDKMVVEKIFTPDDLYNQYLSNKGSIYGISSNDRMTAFKRPPNRHRKIKNLYFAGGSTHPGGGIPLVLLSGKHAADLIEYYS